MKTPGPRTLLALAAAGGAAHLLARRRGWSSYRGRTVLITGGSRGLGLALARRLATEKAYVAVLARSRTELEVVEKDLRSRTRGPRIRVIEGDVGSRSSVESAVDEVVRWTGHLDLLVNNAGVILSAPFENHRLEDFEHALAIHLLGPLHAMRAALPHMRRQGGGRILNISSIGGKIGVPHLSAYCASKFALTGLSQTLAAELRGTGVRVTVACPGLMRTGSNRSAHFGGDREREYAWFAAFSSAPLLSMKAEKAAARILRATRRGTPEVNVSLPWRLAAAGAGAFPNLAVAANAWVEKRVMPSPTSADPDPAPGLELQGERPPVGWVERNEAAAARLNQS